MERRMRLPFFNDSFRDRSLLPLTSNRFSGVVVSMKPIPLLFLLPLSVRILILTVFATPCVCATVHVVEGGWG